MRPRAAAIALAGILTLAACGSSAPASHTAAAPTVTPASQIIASAAACECSAFSAVYAQVQASIAGTSPAATVPVVQANASSWNAGLEHASKDDPPGVPIGGNAANDLAASISKAAVDLGFARLDALTGKPAAYLTDLGRFLKDASRLSATCRHY